MNENIENQSNIDVYKNSIRGCYLIIPVLAKGNFNPVGLKEVEVSKSVLEDKSNWKR